MRPVDEMDRMNGRWLIWVDGVGGFLLIPGTQWMIGGPSGSAEAEICIHGDLLRRQACICRQGSDYVLQPLAGAWLSGRRMDRPAVLRNGDRIVLGPEETWGPRSDDPQSATDHDRGVPSSRGVHLRFAQPHPLSPSARLVTESRHRGRPHVDGIILLAETCVLGPAESSHIVAPEAEGEVVMVYREQRWWCRSGTETIIDGRPHRGRAGVAPGQRIEAGGLAFSLEVV